MPAPPATNLPVVTDDGTELATRRHGGGPRRPLVLCNSLGTDLSLWEPQVGVWARDRSVVRFDTRGHGASGAPPPPYVVERLGRDALQVLDAHHLDVVDVCGLSLGGLVATWLAANAPERIGRVILADTAARVGTEEAWRTRAETVRVEGMAAVAEAVLERFFRAAYRARDAAGVERVRRMLLATPVDGYVGACEALAVADLGEDAGRIAAACLVVVGTADEATPVADAQRLRGLIPGARLVTIAGAGHLANVEEPERFASLVRDFLDAPA